MIPEPPSNGSEGLREIPRPAYDVCNPDRLPADRVTFVDGIHQQFLQAFSQQLTSYLDTPVEMIPAGFEQAPANTFLAASVTDACLLTLDLRPIRGQAWVGLSPGLVFRVLDIVLGAPQATAPAARTSITEIEQHVLREFFQILLSTLGTAWQASGISMHLASLGPAQDSGQVADAEGTALILNSTVRILEGEESFHMAIPVLAIRLAALQHEQNAAAQAAIQTPARAALLEAVSSASMELEAVLGGSNIRLGDLAAMQPGQILVLSQPAGSQLDCRVNGKTKFRGEWISHGDRHGLQIEALVTGTAKS